MAKISVSMASTIVFIWFLGVFGKYDTFTDMLMSLGFIGCMVLIFLLEKEDKYPTDFDA